MGSEQRIANSERGIIPPAHVVVWVQHIFRHEEAMVSVTAVETQELKATDRCDACGAQAYVRVTMESGELLFCGHHARANESALREVAVDWDDQTDRIK